MTITLNGGDDIVCQVQLLQASQSVPTHGLDGVMGETGTTAVSDLDYIKSVYADPQAWWRFGREKGAAAVSDLGHI